jgi:hypothetical protein
MPQFIFPNAYELSRIEMDLLPVLTEDDPAFDMFPIVTKDAPRIIWEQRGNFTGLMPGRAANASASLVKLVGGNRFEMDPGRYSAFAMIEEAEIEQMRDFGEYHEPMSLDEQVMVAQDRLLNNRLNRMRFNIWTLLSTGIITVNAPNGGIIYSDTYPFQTVTTINAWSNFANSTPLADMRYIKLLARGHSVRFDRAGKAYMNLGTMNNLLANTNQGDIGGKRRDVGATFNSLENVNEVFTANDLPNIEGYDEGYLDDSGVFHTFIPDNTVVIIGRRINGDPVGEFQLTRNAANADAAPGPYTFITDSTQTGIPIPRGLRIDDGFNGGIACWYPSAVLILKVGGGGSGIGTLI